MKLARGDGGDAEQNVRRRTRIHCWSAACDGSRDLSSKFSADCGEWIAARKIPLASEGGNAMFSASISWVIREVVVTLGSEVKRGECGMGAKEPPHIEGL